MGKIKKFLKNIFVVLYYLPGIIWQPAIHYKVKEN